MSTLHNVITPGDIARELGLSPKTLRAYLRKRYPDHRKNQRWELTPEQADDVRRNFGRKTA